MSQVVLCSAAGPLSHVGGRPQVAKSEGGEKKLGKASELIRKELINKGEREEESEDWEAKAWQPIFFCNPP